MRRVALLLFLSLTLTDCGAPPTLTPGPARATNPPPILSPTNTAASPARRFSSPTPPPNPGTTVTVAGQSKILSHLKFYWTLKLPQDWVITYDRGFEVLANNPNRTAFMRLLSQVWDSNARLPTARDYVNYWKNDKYGNLFPMYAQGTQVSETEISRDKFGGPYLRYEFDDSKNGMHYLQVYASGGGPNSVVLTTWAKSADFDNVKTVMEGILSSLELLK